MIAPRLFTDLDPLRVERVGGLLSLETATHIGCARQEMVSLIDTGDPRRDYWLSMARGQRPKLAGRPKGSVRTVDLFSGAGGLSLGARLAAEAIGRRHVPVLAADIDTEALDVHEFNLMPRRTFRGSVRELFDPTLLDAASSASDVSPEAITEASWVKDLGGTDIVVGGPPCQGHSNLNNKTRRNDERNELYRWMALAAYAMAAKIVVIENVPTVKADAGDVVQRTIALLKQLGYFITFDSVVAGDRIGLPQTRRRHFLVAIRSDVLDANWGTAANWIGSSFGYSTTALQAIEDLQDKRGPSSFDTPSELSKENRERVKWLHENDVFDLPDHLRPECHQDGNHNYSAVYGRMHPDRPAPTLSTGFLSPGRGRFGHPTRSRGLTLHEAARLQGFPDFFSFVGASGVTPKRTSIARMIGDAVPPPLAFHVVLGALAMVRPGGLGD